MPPAPPAARLPSWLGPATWLIPVLAGLAVIWAFPIFPTQDGPSHVYTATVLAALDTPPEEGATAATVYSRFYEADWTWVPNLGASALLRSLVPLVGGASAEKLLLSLALLLFAAGLVVLLRTPTDRWPPIAALGPPLILGFSAHMGFYSFVLGLAVVPWGWWLCRTATSWRGTMALALIGALAFVCHPLAVLAVLAGALVVQRTAWLPAIAGLLPAAALLGHYLLTAADSTAPERWSGGKLVETWAFLRAATAATGAQEWLAMALAAAITIATVLTVARDTEWPTVRRWLLLAAALFAGYLITPNGGSGFWFASERLSLLPWLALLPVAARLRGPLTLAWPVAALTLLALHIGPHARVNAALADYAEAAAGVQPGERLLSFDPSPDPTLRFRPFLHAASRIAAEKGAIDLGNYEPHTDHFQLRLAPYIRTPSPTHVMSAQVDLHRWRPQLDAVLVQTPTPPLELALKAAGFTKTTQKGETTLYRPQAQPPSPRRPGDLSVQKTRPRSRLSVTAPPRKARSTARLSSVVAERHRTVRYPPCRIRITQDTEEVGRGVGFR